MKGFKIGSVIYLNGTTPSGGPEMVFNIRHDDKNIALHFNPRFNQKCVVLNSFEDGAWKNEQRCELPPPPFGPNEPYSAVIICKKEGYDIVINGKYFTHFDHRLPIQEEISFEVSPHPEEEKYSP